MLLSCLLISASAIAAASGNEMLTAFKAEDMEGNTVDLKEIIGRQPLMLVFWASWCPTCRSEVPRINRLYDALVPKGMRFIGINIGHNDSLARAQAFMDKTGMKYPVIFDKGGVLSREYKVMGVPTILIAGQDGSIMYRGYKVPDDSLIENFSKLQK